MPTLPDALDPNANDVAVSGDGSRIYSAGADGNLRVFDAATGELLNIWDVGTQLGGIDISPDGSFLVAAELVPLEANWGATPEENQFTIAAYKVDLSTGAVTTYSHVVTGNTYVFDDVAVLANGEVLLTHKAVPGSEAWSPLNLLDLGSGSYVPATDDVYPNDCFLSPASDGTLVLIAAPNNSNNVLFLYQSGVGIIDARDGFYDNHFGFNEGVQAFSGAAGLVAQYLDGSLNIYDTEFNHLRDLSIDHPQWSFSVAGVSFSDDGQFLFVLDSISNSITQLSVGDWSVANTILLNFDVTQNSGGFGNIFTVSPDGQYFTVLTEDGLVYVDDPDIIGTTGDDTLIGSELFNYIRGLAGDDHIEGLGGDDILDGGPGNDTLDGGAGNDLASYVNATAGVAVNLSLSSPQDTGGAGTDTLISVENLDGSSFDDILTGDAGANSFVGHAGSDAINGGDGFDTVDYTQDRVGRIIVNLGATPINLPGGGLLSANQALDSFGNVDTLTSIEHIITGGDYDHIVGSDRDEIFETGGGQDSLFGGGGADVLIGGTGNDTYYFSLEEGDTIIETADGGQDDLYALDAVMSLESVENVENLFGTLVAGQTLIGNSGDNYIVGVAGRSGADILRGEGGDDQIQAFRGNDSLFGDEGNDSLLAGDGADYLDGGSGSDWLVGGNGNDILTGGDGSDALTGGAGSDFFKDTAAGLSGDAIADFSPGDKIIITDATLDGFTFGISGNTLTYTGGTLTLSTVPAGRIVASAAAAGGGVELTIADARNDFNGDGRSDILWRHESGQMINWLGQTNGGFVSNADANAGIDWNIASTGDFNGDGRDDVLWRNNDGSLTDWLAQPNGSFSSNFGNAYYQVATSWNVAGVGDFNGDGRDDILWRHDSGQLIDWLGQTNGGFVSNADANAGTDWNVASIGDFNGDGRDDILWRNDDGSLTDWLGQANGSFASNFENAYYEVDNHWVVAGTGDFNGDGRDDILWRHDSGQLINWLGQASGGFVSNADANAGIDWTIVSIGDFNGDGRDDVLWRKDDGSLTNWLGQANGSFASNFENAYYEVDTSWHVQPGPDNLLM